MADELPWIFHGYRTPAGNPVVQEWFDALLDDVKDEIRDSLTYYENVERHLWIRPGFDELGGEGISEFQFKADGVWYRIYGGLRPSAPRVYVSSWLREEGQERQGWETDSKRPQEET